MNYKEIYSKAQEELKQLEIDQATLSEKINAKMQELGVEASDSLEETLKKLEEDTDKEISELEAKLSELESKLDEQI